MQFFCFACEYQSSATLPYKEARERTWVWGCGSFTQGLNTMTVVTPLSTELLTDRMFWADLWSRLIQNFRFSSTLQTRWLAKMIIPSQSVRWTECCMNLPRRIFKFPHLSCVTKYIINLSVQVIDPKSQKNPSESEMNSLLLERVI